MVLKHNLVDTNQIPVIKFESPDRLASFRNRTGSFETWIHQPLLSITEQLNCTILSLG